MTTARRVLPLLLLCLLCRRPRGLPPRTALRPGRIELSSWRLGAAASRSSPGGRDDDDDPFLDAKKPESSRKRKDSQRARGKSRGQASKDDTVHDPSDIGVRGQPLQSVHLINAHVEQLLREKTVARLNGKNVADPSALGASQEALWKSLIEDEHMAVTRFHVLVCFGKRLVRDQVTLEYASRIRTMVKYLKRLHNTGHKLPDVICFTGGYMGDSAISSATAGYIFFRQMAEYAGVDITSSQLLLEEESEFSRDAIDLIVPEIAEAAAEGGVLPGETLHYTLISTTHHLRRLAHVHVNSARSSMLKKIEDAGGTYTFLKSSYPYLASPDEGLRFLANIILVVEELVPVLVNLEAATTGSEWFNRDNLRILTEACHSLRELVQSLNDPTKQPHPERFRERSPRNPFYSSAARKKLLSGAYALLLGEELEDAVSSITKVKNLIESAVYGKEYSGMRSDLDTATRLLGQTVAAMRGVLDPDRPLQMNEMVGLLQEQRKSNGS